MVAVGFALLRARPLALSLPRTMAHFGVSTKLGEVQGEQIPQPRKGSFDRYGKG
jgi:hypothetical protein